MVDTDKALGDALMSKPRAYDLIERQLVHAARDITQEFSDLQTPLPRVLNTTGELIADLKQVKAPKD